MKTKTKFSREDVLCFFVGLWGLTQIHIGGYLGISELIMAMIAPFSLARNFQMFVRDKMMRIISLSLLWAFGAVLSDMVLDNPLPLILKGVAPSLVVFSTIVVVYPLLRRSPESLKWLVFGLAISGVVCIFIFRPGAGGGSDGSVEGMMSYKLFYVNQLSTWLGLPIRGWYLSIPTWFSVASAVFIGMFALASGGRSDFLIAIISAVLICLGRKRADTMQWIRKHFIYFVLVCLASLAIIRTVYFVAAQSGFMTEADRTKIEHQTSDKDRGILRILMSGRAEFFIALFAALDRPILGHGTYALDTAGYRHEFISRYGNDEDVQRMILLNETAVGQIPSHSHILGEWMNHGIFGGLFWLYVLGLIFQTIRRRMGVYPPWYGYLCMMIPFAIWSIPFSPFGQRPIIVSVIVVCCVLRSIDRDLTVARMQRNMMR